MSHAQAVMLNSKDKVCKESGHFMQDAHGKEGDEAQTTECNQCDAHTLVQLMVDLNTKCQREEMFTSMFQSQEMVENPNHNWVSNVH